MERLWVAERESGSSRLRLETLAQLGGAASIVRDHLEGALETLSTPQKEAAARMFDHLVTPSGTKIAHGVSDLAQYARAPAPEIEPVLRALAEKRILRPVANGGDGGSFEIFHDVLADAVLDWRTRWDAQRGLEQARAEAERRRRGALIVAAVALLGLAAMTVVAVFALAQRREARSQEHAARRLERAAGTRALVANALTQLSTDPQRALATAVEAARRERTPATGDAVRRALLESRVRRTARIGSPVRSLAVTRDGRVVAATRRGLLVLDADLRAPRRLALGGRFLGVHGDDIAMLGPRGIELHRLDGTLRRRIPVRPGASLSVHNLETGDLIGTIDVPKQVRLTALGPKGTLLALSGTGRRVVVVNVLTGEGRYDLSQPARVTSLAFGPASRRLAVGLADGTAGLWRIRTGTQSQRLRGHRGPIRDLSFSPRTTLIATGSNDGTARVWRIGSGALVAPMAGHTNPVLDVVWSPDGRVVATGSADGTARVWKADTGAQLAVLRGHTAPVTTVAFARGSAYLLTGGEDGTVRLWDVREQPELRQLARFTRPVTRVRFAGPRIDATTADNRLHVLDGRGRPLAVRRAEPAPLVRAPDGATARLRGKTVVIRRPDRRELTLRGHQGRVTAAHFSPDGKLLVTTSRDRTARIWSARTGHLLRVLRGHFGPVQDAVFSPDGRWIVTAGPTTAALWEAATGQRVLQLQGHRGALTTVAFDPAGERILTGGVDGTVRFYACEICRGGDRLVAAAVRRLRTDRP
jgi:WD40 repeat protein